MSARALARAIQRGELPFETIRTLPAQSLYRAIQLNGVESSLELLEAATVEQYKLLLDFELWGKDQIDEDRLWQWLAVVDDDESLTPLHKFLASLDLKVLSRLISLNVEVEIFEEPTDNPPGPLWFTPDKGFTWLFLKPEDAEQHRLLGKILAFVFETNAQLFYQIISIPKVATPSELEEEAYQERRRRLSDEGIPSHERSVELHAPLDAESFQTLLLKTPNPPTVEGVSASSVLVYDESLLQPLQTLLESIMSRGISARSELEAEITLIVNSSFVFNAVGFSAVEEVQQVMDAARGTLNIGLQAAHALSDLSPLGLYELVGLEPLYRLGRTEIMTLRKLAREARAAEEGILQSDPVREVTIEGAARDLPLAPLFLTPRGEVGLDEGGSVPSGFRPFHHLVEIQAIKSIIRQKGH